MSNLVKINNHDLQAKELNGQRVVTFKDIEILHERVEGTAGRNFRENREHFIENVDYFKICPDEIRRHNVMDISNKAREDITLITESGYLMLVKSLTDDLAWKVQRELVNNYFRGQQQKPQCLEDVMIAQLQEMKVLRKQLNQVNNNVLQANIKAEESKQEVQAIRDVVTLSPNAWKNEVTNLLNKIAKERGGTAEAYREVRNESYKYLDERAGSKLSIRLTNRKRKVLEETGSKSKADKVSKIDVIADDKRLTEVYLAIVKEMAIKYKVA